MKSIHRHVGQLLLVGFEGQTIPTELCALAREWDLGGVVLFARNIDAPEQVAELTFEIQELAHDLPLWVGIDQEGGRVARLRAPFTEWPPMAALGRLDDPALTRRFAAALADELTAVGVSLDFTPVLDLFSESADPVIGDRALSSDPDTVGRLGRIIIEELRHGGVAACAKHFPGHGEVLVDSHQELPLVEHSPDRLRAKEISPFRSAIATEVAAVMTAHVLYPALDREYPATLSSAIVDNLLRRELGHDGLIITDDLDMGAISGTSRSVEQAAVQALVAGCDTVLVCGESMTQHASTLEAIIHAVEGDELDSRRVEDAWARIRRVKAQYLAGKRPHRPLSGGALRARLGTSAHHALAEEMSRGHETSPTA